MYSVKVERGLKNNPTAADIRTAVFVQEQGFKNEFEERDESSHHLVIFEENIPAATCRAYQKDSAGGIFMMGRVAVLPSHRGKHLGAAAVTEMENYLKKLGATDIELSAQLDKKGFYEKLGYISYGDVFKDEHCDHINMKKHLD